MKLSIILSFLFAGFLSPLYAQQIREDTDIQRAMQIYHDTHPDKSECKGWRIQVVATTNRRKMESVKWSFKKKLPYYHVFWTYKDPYYYVKAGAFVTRLEALHALEEIKKKFSGAYIVKDKMPCSALF